jgi:lipoate-protein ligase A
LKGLIFLKTPQEASAAFNMAVDACFSAKELSEPVLRIYRFRGPTLTLGFSQQPEKALWLDEAAEKGIEVCRRITGGKALLHDRGLTYSIIVPRKILGDSVRNSYNVLSNPVFKALSRFRQDLVFAADHRFRQPENTVCFLEHEVETICADGAKIVGSAQKRNRLNVLQHGEINVLPGRFFCPGLFRTNMDNEELEKACDERIGFLCREAEPELYVQLMQEIKLEFEKLFGISGEYHLKSEETKKIACLAEELAVFPAGSVSVSREKGSG